ncbi:MAG: ThiF family adenylyltransferase [Candidatus Thermoplasmatota archaeon]
MDDVLTEESKFTRFQGLEWFDPNYTILIGGVGGIGSWLSLFLSRAGYELYIHDNDMIDETNMGGQLYSTLDIGKNKAKAMKEHLWNFTANDKIHTMGLFDKKSFANPIMFSAFDNMKARKIMFEKWKKQKNRNIFIDGRLLAESFQIFTVIPGREEDYEKHLFDDDDVEDLLCSVKATSHCGAMIASTMMSIFTNHIANQKSGFEGRDVPFKYLFDIPLLLQTI